MVDTPYDETATTVVPAWEDWPARLRANRALPAPLSVGLGPDDLRSLRRRTVDAARDFVAHLERVAGQHGVLLPALPEDLDLESLSAGRLPLVMTGHQPTVFHPGLIFKYQMTERFARDQHTRAIAIVLDTDQGDAGQFLVPQAVRSSTTDAGATWPVVGADHETLADPATLFRDQHVLSQGELSALSDRVSRQLDQCQAHGAATTAVEALASYGKLAGCSAAQANSIVRRAAGLAVHLLELPFSTLCAFPEVQQFFRHLILDCGRFHQLYNATLTAWRQQRKLRNPANPFPNLGLRGNRRELPFWMVDLVARRRDTVWAEPLSDAVRLYVDDVPLADVSVGAPLELGAPTSQRLLIPRGALITIVFRLLASDLFVHGLGGQSYDPCTDQLIRNYFAFEPPAFTVASASRYLLDDPRRQLERLDQLAAQQRSLLHHPDTHLGAGWFSAELEDRLRPLLERKQSLVETLRSKKQSGESAAEQGRELAALRDEIELRISAEFAPQLEQRTALTPAARQAIESRTYPWFYFEW